MPKIKSVEVNEKFNNQLNEKFWLYTIFICILSLVFIQWNLVSYRLKHEGILNDSMIALMYMLAMLADALIAIPAGILYDKYGLKTLYSLPLLILFSTIVLILSQEVTLIVIAILIWGSINALYEINTRAAISDLVELKYRGYAYGTFGLFLGISMMVNGIVYGYIYTYFKDLIIPLTLILSLISIIFLKMK